MTPEQTNAEVLSLLRTLQKDVGEIKASIAVRATVQRAGETVLAATGGEVATDDDLDGQYGDPTIKYPLKAKYWTGDDYTGFRFSETPPEHLDAMAKYLDACAFMAAKDPDEKKRGSARYKAMDAARARGWAARLRAGGGPPPRQHTSTGAPIGDAAEDALPF